ncbi:MAG: acyl carrier protein [Acidobacteriota bacterium]|nr:acyl carrier protein [Acidobacteriota bacterium]
MSSDTTPLDETREIESRIIAFIQRELLSLDATVDREDDLLSGEILDSIAILRLSVFVEEEFQLNIQPADYVIENFQNVAVIAEFVQRTDRRAQHAAADSGQ